jgi:hypothetical protein
MTNKVDSKGGQSVGSDETRALGKRSDPKVKADRPQVSDKDKLSKAVLSIDDLSARMEQLDKSSGPFGNDDDIDFKAGRVSSLLDDVAPAKPPSAEKKDDEGEVSLDDILGNSVTDTQADVAAGNHAQLEDDDDLIETTPFMNNELAAMEDDDYSAAVDDLLSEVDDEGLLDEQSDPIDDMVDAQFGTEASEQSPFAALFTPVDTDEDFYDPGVDEIEVSQGADIGQETVDFDDDSLFFDDEIDIQVSNEGRVHEAVTLPGAGSFADEEDEAIFEDQNKDADGSADDEDPSSGLPQLTMGGDDDFYAPGTDYADDEVAHTSEDRDFADSYGSEETPAKADKMMKKEDGMATSEYGSDEDQKNLDDLDSLEDGQDENTFDAANIDAFSDDETSDRGDGTFEGEDLDDLLNDDDNHADEASDGDLDQEDSAEDDAADAIFGDDDEAEAVTPVAPVLVSDTDHHPRVEMQEGEAAEGARDEAQADPVKKKPVKAALLAAASFAILGGIGLAAWNGAIPGVDLNPAAGYPPNAVQVTDTGEEIDTPGQVASVDIDKVDPIAPIAPKAEVSDKKGTVRLADLMGAKTEDTSDEPMVPTDITDLMDDPSTDVVDEELDVLTVDDTPFEDEIVIAEGEGDASVTFDDTIDGDDIVVAEVDDIEGGVDGEVSADTEIEGQPDLIVVEEDASDDLDAISALAAEINNATGAVDDAALDEKSEEADVAEAKSSVFVGEERVADVEADVVDISKNIEALAEEVSKMNTLMVQTMERNSTIATRVESNERSLRTVTAILTEFTGVRESLDQTQIVLLDIAARVGSLEASNPADKQEVGTAIKEINGELKRLTANMAILARMTVNGVSALEAPNASAGNNGVQTSNSKAPGAGNDTVFADDTKTFRATTPPAGAVPSDVENGDFVEGYGYVLDVVPASGNQNLVVMENGSVLVPK